MPQFNPKTAAIWRLLEQVTDPEIPVVSLRELGILRAITPSDAGFDVVITPTYSGCPAMGQIEDDVTAALAAAGVAARVVTQLAPAWTTDWLTKEGKDKLRAYGIAPPQQQSCGGQGQASVIQFMQKPAVTPAIVCPQCGSTHTVVSAEFGSTACKALYKCLSCQEPFDYFKPY